MRFSTSSESSASDALTTSPLSLLSLFLLLPLLPLVFSASTPLSADINALPSPSIPAAEKPSISSELHDSMNARGLVTITDSLNSITRPYLPKDKSGVPAFLAHLRMMELSNGGDPSFYPSSLRLRQSGTLDDVGQGVKVGKTGWEGENVGVVYDEQSGSTVGVHDVTVDESSLPAGSPGKGRMVGRRHKNKRWLAHEKDVGVKQAGQSVGLGVGSEGEGEDEEMEVQPHDGGLRVMNGHEHDYDYVRDQQRRDGNGNGAAAAAAVGIPEEAKDEDAFRLRQATRAQVIARQKWKARDTAPQPAISGQVFSL